MSSTETQSATYNLSSDPPTNEIMLKLEKTAEIQVAQFMAPVVNANPIEKIEFIAKQGPDFEDTLVSIMSSGAQEFAKKTGRQMTYSELRAMYG
jgi:hypothetical protein